MDAWECLQLNMQWCQLALISTEAALEEDHLDLKSLFLLSNVEALPYPAELAKKLMVPKPTITFIIKRMENAGYLKRQTVEGDLRKFAMVITPLGRTVQKRGRNIVTEALEKTLGKLTTAEREAFISTILKMNRND